MKPFLLLLLVLAGAAITTQSAVNSQLRGALHSVGWAVFISYLGGSLVAGALLLLTRTPLPALAELGSLKWYYWTGGLLGVGYVLTITFSLQRVGAASLFALVVAGQLLTALLYDQLGVLNLSRSPLSSSKLVGVALLVLGAYLLNRK
ncbi:DMT family transporter [Hymenobacter sp. BRD67]|uniref:DMT family transporter n=1 Tax=Hymenobacter sp. BRD67 TaxID=2675877 RepID=UPI00156724D7|nr:DMT family transporter [Hymenobacter sp. BRD67]QKG51679.1 DMT family transporter [Hymenobacter sp. BRD67]